MYDVSLQIESEFNGDVKSIVPAEHKKPRHKWVPFRVLSPALCRSGKINFDEKLSNCKLNWHIFRCFSLALNRFRHQHHDHERCKERRRRKKRKILVHNLDDKSLKVRKQKNTRYGLPVSAKKRSRYLSFRPRKLGNRSRWAAATCKVHHHRHRLSSADNVSAAGRNHPANGTSNRRHGWVILLRPSNVIAFSYSHADTLSTAALRWKDEKISFVSMLTPVVLLYYSWPWAVYSIFSSIRLIPSY